MGKSKSSKKGKARADQSLSDEEVDLGGPLPRGTNPFDPIPLPEPAKSRPAGPQISDPLEGERPRTPPWVRETESRRRAHEQIDNARKEGTIPREAIDRLEEKLKNSQSLLSRSYPSEHQRESPKTTESSKIIIPEDPTWGPSTLGFLEQAAQGQVNPDAKSAIDELMNGHLMVVSEVIKEKSRVERVKSAGKKEEARLQEVIHQIDARARSAKEWYDKERGAEKERAVNFEARITDLDAVIKARDGRIKKLVDEDLYTAVLEATIAKKQIAALQPKADAFDKAITERDDAMRELINVQNDIDKDAEALETCHEVRDTLNRLLLTTKNKCTLLEDEKAVLKDSNTALTNEKSALQAIIDSTPTSNDRAGKDSRIYELETELKSLKPADSDGSSNGSADRCASERAQITELEKERSALKEELEALEKQSELANTKLKNRVSDLEDDKKELEIRLTELETHLRVARDDIEAKLDFSINETCKALAAKCQSLEAEVLQAATLLEECQSQLGDETTHWAAQVRFLEQRLAASAAVQLPKTVQNLQVEIADLRAQLVESRKKLAEDTKRLTAERAEAKSESIDIGLKHLVLRSALEKQLVECQAKLLPDADNNLQLQIVALNHQVAALQAERDDLDAQVVDQADAGQLFADITRLANERDARADISEDELITLRDTLASLNAQQRTESRRSSLRESVGTVTVVKALQDEIVLLREEIVTLEKLREDLNDDTKLKLKSVRDQLDDCLSKQPDADGFEAAVADRQNQIDALEKESFDLAIVTAAEKQRFQNQIQDLNNQIIILTADLVHEREEKATDKPLAKLQEFQDRIDLLIIERDTAVNNATAEPTSPNHAENIRIAALINGHTDATNRLQNDHDKDVKSYREEIQRLNEQYIDMMNATRHGPELVNLERKLKTSNEALNKVTAESEICEDYSRGLEDAIVNAEGLRDEAVAKANLLQNKIKELDGRLAEDSSQVGRDTKEIDRLTKRISDLEVALADSRLGQSKKAPVSKGQNFGSSGKGNSRTTHPAPFADDELVAPPGPVSLLAGAVARMQVGLRSMMYQRATYGYVEGDVTFALQAAQDAEDAAEEMLNAGLFDVADTHVYKYWHGIVRYYADHIDDARESFQVLHRDAPDDPPCEWMETWLHHTDLNAEGAPSTRNGYREYLGWEPVLGNQDGDFDGSSPVVKNTKTETDPKLTSTSKSGAQTHMIVAELQRKLDNCLNSKIESDSRRIRNAERRARRECRANFSRRKAERKMKRDANKQDIEQQSPEATLRESKAREEVEDDSGDNPEEEYMEDLSSTPPLPQLNYSDPATRYWLEQNPFGWEFSSTRGNIPSLEKPELGAGSKATVSPGEESTYRYANFPESSPEDDVEDDEPEAQGLLGWHRSDWGTESPTGPVNQGNLHALEIQRLTTLLANLNLQVEDCKRERLELSAEVEEKFRLEGRIAELKVQQKNRWFWLGGFGGF